MAKKEKVINICTSILITIVLGKIFYGEYKTAIFLIPIGICFYKSRKRQLENKEKIKKEKQFKDMLISISDSLSTGYSMENAIRESYKDMVNAHGKKAEINKEIQIMLSQIKLNMPLEKVFMNFSERSQIEDAFVFSQILSVARKRGGRLTEIIKNITDTIVLKESVKEDIELSINEKKLEQRIMSCIPIFLVIFISASSPGFMDVMYETWMGKIVMTVCLIVYVIAYLWALKMTEIEV